MGSGRDMRLTLATTLDLQADLSLPVEALAVPEEDPDARWKM